MNESPRTQKAYDRLCDETLAYFRTLAGQYPQITMYQSICNQIVMIRQDLAAKGSLDPVKDFQKYSLGAIAAKNLDGDKYGRALASIDAMAFIYCDMPPDELQTPDEMYAFVCKIQALMEQPFEEYYFKRRYRARREELMPCVEKAREVLKYVRDFLENHNDGSELGRINLEECSVKTGLSLRYAVSFSMYEVVPAIIGKLEKMRREGVPCRVRKGEAVGFSSGKPEETVASDDEKGRMLFFDNTFYWLWNIVPEGRFCDCLFAPRTELRTARRMFWGGLRDCLFAVIAVIQFSFLLFSVAVFMALLDGVGWITRLSASKLSGVLLFVAFLVIVIRCLNTYDELRFIRLDVRFRKMPAATVRAYKRLFCGTLLLALIAAVAGLLALYHLYTSD
ncbi:MAG: hypothetical protein HG422_03480 [Prevotella sp.]|nr:hypothetical protein [Prevotella sp.]